MRDRSARRPPPGYKARRCPPRPGRGQTPGPASCLAFLSWRKSSFLTSHYGLTEMSVTCVRCPPPVEPWQSRPEIVPVVGTQLTRGQGGWKFEQRVCVCQCVVHASGSLLYHGEGEWVESEGCCFKQECVHFLKGGGEGKGGGGLASISRPD